MGEECLRKKFKNHTQTLHKHKRKCLSFIFPPHKLSRRLKMQGTSATGASQMLPLPTELSNTCNFFFFFDKCNHFSRAIQSLFMYSEALPRGSLLGGFKNLSAGDGSSVVAEGQSHRLQANLFQLPVLQSSPCIQDPGAPTEV